MDGNRFSIHRMTLRAFDLSERGARAGKRSAQRRWERLRSRSFMIIQCAVTAGLAWLLASLLIGPRPFFSAVAAIITLGFSFGQRWRRALEVAAGVAVGVGIGDLFVHIFGTGTWQIILVCIIAMAIAVLLGAGNLMITQAGVQAIIAITLFPNPGAGVTRWLDALVGCGLALIVATIAPIGPIRRPGRLGAGFLQEVASTVRAAAASLRNDDPEAGDAVLERARRGEALLEDISDAADEGLAVVRNSPFLRGRRSEIRAFAGLYPPLDRLSRNLRVLARRSAVALWRDETVPLASVVLLEQLADVINFMAGELYEGRIPERARQRLLDVGQASTQVGLADSLSAIVVLAQTRSMIVDLLEVSGMSATDAREAIGELD
ncbi:FUSC family protein [Microlunatus soli]|uniref:Uncharacterized membrane protein YgaE, UPF0421/DUF939 family n=1 Tax=Microlunatus soli TaxID=630515 RepID=A0A1H1MLA0_9ACTN|nr:FUSC family protein [Microlunatus soli]SDR87155.1 Uncharacterized membrane protein YgaE, UPF0421/DUF939 family [Microlunatus soli]